MLGPSIFFLGLQGFLMWLGFSNGWFLLWFPALVWMISTLISLIKAPTHRISPEARRMGYEICPNCGETFDTVDPEQLISLRRHECR